MSREGSLTHRRIRLLILMVPGVLLCLLPILAGPAQPTNPGISFGEWRLISTILGVLLSGGGALVHKKAVAEFSGSGRPYWKTVLFITAPVVVVVPLAAVALEWSIGFYLAATSRTAMPVFPPYAKVSFRTAEFAYTAEANSIGIRDREVDLRRKAGPRIIAIGDSFTYGWGVDVADSWPRVLQRRLTERGRRAEVLNLGCPGTSVDAYAEIAQRAIPLLKPDFVLVAVLQGDDLGQLHLGKTTHRLCCASGSSLRTVTRRLMRPPPVAADQVRDQWQRGARWIQDHLTAEQRQRFDHMDAEVKAMFIRGDLNPNLVQEALKHPDYLSFTLNPDQGEVRQAIGAMARCLEEIKEAAEEENAKVIVLSVPWCYVSASLMASMRRIGFRLDDRALRSDAPDEVIRSACRMVGVEFHTFTGRFREVAADQRLFFEFDSHFNSVGHSLFGEEVSQVLFEQMDFRSRERAQAPRSLSR